MRKPFWKTSTVLLLLTFSLTGCSESTWRAWYLNGCDRDIKKATKQIEAATDDATRAKGYAARGSAYSEKARYSRAFHLITLDAYNQQYALAIQDHDESIRLDAKSAENYFKRGKTYYDRATVETPKEAPVWYTRAAADFSIATQYDPKHDLAFDMLGVAYESTQQYDKAIEAYTHEMALKPFGKVRLADAYCARGGQFQKAKKISSAIMDFEKSIELGASTDGCSCDPYNPLLGIYIQDLKRYDKAWNLVTQAKKEKRWIGEDLLENLKRESGKQ